MAAPSMPEARPRDLSAGFSLTELIMALVILLILIPSVIPIYDSFVNDSKEEALKERLGQVRRAIVAFKLENGRYPYQIFDHYGNNVDFLNEDYSELTQGIHNGADSYPEGRRIYLDRLPVDPFTEKANWKLLGVDNDGDGSFNEDPIEVTTSTHWTMGATRAFGGLSEVPSSLEYIPDDSDQDGLVDEDPVDVYDIRSRHPEYGDL